MVLTGKHVRFYLRFSLPTYILNLWVLEMGLAYFIPVSEIVGNENKMYISTKSIARTPKDTELS